MARAVVTQSGFVVTGTRTHSSIWRITVVFSRRNDCRLIVFYFTIASGSNRALILIHGGRVVGEGLGTQTETGIGRPGCCTTRNCPVEVGAGSTIGNCRTDILSGFKTAILIEVNPCMERGGVTSAVDNGNAAEAIGSPRRNVGQSRKGIFISWRLVIVIGGCCCVLQSTELTVDIGS